ncbi:hypothetical protein SSCG_00548 [Streptomyces clavuligerus]|nr:hypothetical protein SSCG_00548 [Streptomyces clavuligerus]
MSDHEDPNTGRGSGRPAPGTARSGRDAAVVTRLLRDRLRSAVRARPG